MSSKNPQTPPKWGGHTLRQRLLRFILIPLLLSLLIAGSVSFFTARKETAEIYDKQLVLLARVLHSLARQEDGDEETHNLTRFDTILGDYNSNSFFYRIWIGGKLVLTSPNARSFKSEFRSPGFSDHTFGGNLWRVFVFRDQPNGIAVEVAGRENLRSDIIQEILLVMFVPLLASVPVITVLVWFGIIGGLKPISLLSGLIKSRDPHNLSPLSTREIQDGDMPDEITPLVDALNTLMSRTRRVLEDEKSFTDHAAHELRTPLAAIKVQAQVALRTAEGEEKQQMLEDLVSGVNRASHLVSQLLWLARTQAQQQKPGRVFLDAVLNTVINEFSGEVAKRHQTMEVNIAANTEITGSQELLNILFRNLIDNAVKYTPDSGTISIGLHQGQKDIVFTICNDGPGIPAHERQNIFKHFYRIAGSSEIGCGLGLALADRICEMHNAQIILKDLKTPNQTCFKVTFPTRQPTKATG